MSASLPVKPASQCARRYGVKCVIYGGPGTGKTPMFCATAPNPLLLAAESGLMSVRHYQTPTFECHTPKEIDQVTKWLESSAEVRKYQTIGIDSISEWASILLEKHKEKNSHGLKAYGLMAEEVLKLLRRLYFATEVNLVLLAKLDLKEVGETQLKRPYFPGKELNTEIPHLFDEVFYMAPVMNHELRQEQMALRTKGTSQIVARDRSGMLNEFEWPDLGALFQKAQS